MGAELSDGETGAVDADTVAQMGVGEDFRAVADRQGRSAATAAGVVLRF